jgi:hypothetical protein
MKPTLAVTVALAAATSVAGADRSLDAAGGSVYVTSIDGTRAVDYVRTPDGTQAKVEVIPTGPNAPPIQRISHTRAGLAVHAGTGGSAPLTTSLFRTGTGGGFYTPHVLRDPGTGAVTRPASVRTIGLDPGDPGAVLLDASHVLLPQDGQPRALAVVERSSGEAMLVDYDVAGGAIRRTPLGLTAPLGSTKGSFAGTPDGHVWAALASAHGVQLLDLGDLSGGGPLQPVHKGLIPAREGFDPNSTHLGIIAILIGLLAQPAPAVSHQVGDGLILSVFDGQAFRTVARQAIPTDAAGLIESEGIGFDFFYHLLPYIEQDNLYRGTLGQEAEPIMALGR